MFQFICLSAVSFLVSLVFLKYLLSLLSSSTYTCLNFRNKLLPAGTGLLFPMVFLVTMILVAFFGGGSFSKISSSSLVLLVLILGLALLGVLDDLLGDRSISGFKGHFGELARGKLTTGALKALGGGILSFFVAAPFSASIVAQIINALVIALFVNVFNLLDLRPGRALKVFLILGLVISLFSWRSAYWNIWGIFLGPVLVLLWVDLKEKGMLGDVGSNVLGGIVGFSCVTNFSWITNFFILVVLIAVNLYSENNSISKLIEKVSVLRRFDRLGRKV